MRGFEANFAGLSLIVLGTFLISRAKKKQEEIEAQIQYGLMTEAPIEDEGADIYYGG